MTTFRVHFDGKVLVPDEPVDLPVGRSLEVTVSAPADTKRHLDRSVRPLASLADWAETLKAVENAPTDLAAQHDHYRHGSPKRP